MYLSDCIGRRENRIDQIRLGAAFAVLVGHSWHISQGPQAVVPLEHSMGVGFHELAVHVFFFLSGMLIVESARRYQSRILQFTWARMRRLMPALCVNAVVVPLVLVATGFWSPASPEALAEYAARLVTLMSIQFTDPHVFVGHPFEHAINGSVWSLRHEVLLYGVIGLGGLLGMFKRPPGFWLVVMLLAGWSVAGHALADEAQGGWPFILVEGRYLAFSGLLGVLAHRYAGHVPVRLDVTVCLVIWTVVAKLMLPDSLYMLILIVTVCYATLMLAFAGEGQKAGLPHDISYGVYIYAWPVQQMIVGLWLRETGHAIDPWMLVVLATPLVLAAGALSWFLVERPAMRLTYPIKRASRPIAAE